MQSGEDKDLKQSRLTITIFLALILGVFVGWAFPEFGLKTHVLAEVFLRMVKMIIAPLLFATLVVGIAGHGDVKSLGRLGVKTVIYFEIVTTVALIIGLGFANLFKPGEGIVNSAIQNICLTNITNITSTTQHNSFGQMFLGLFPTSIVQAMADGNLLQIVVFSIFFALAICGIGQKARPVLDFLQSTCEIMFKFTEYVMYFSPFGVFGAIAVTIAQNGIGILASYAKFIGIVYLSLIIFAFTVLTLVCKIIKIPFFYPNHKKIIQI